MLFYSAPLTVLWSQQPSVTVSGTACKKQKRETFHVVTAGPTAFVGLFDHVLLATRARDFRAQQQRTMSAKRSSWDMCRCWIQAVPLSVTNEANLRNLMAEGRKRTKDTQTSPGGLPLVDSQRVR